MRADPPSIKFAFQNLEYGTFTNFLFFRDLSTENLEFLTTDQCLADLANFVGFIKENRTELADAPVFAAGFGYGGNLAIWFRKKYPHLVEGVWSSGGALKGKLDFSGILRSGSHKSKLQL